MKNRSPIKVFLLGVVTIGIYSWYWAVKTKGEMNKLGETVPTAWIWLIPIVGSVWWYWKYSEGVEHVTHEKISGILAFVVLYLLGGIGQAIIQDSFNKIEASPAAAPAGSTPAQPTATPTPSQPTVAVAPVSTPQPPSPPVQNQQPPTNTPPGPTVVTG